jgi:hypothetical protein
MGHIARGVTSKLANFDSHRSSALLRVMRLIVFEILLRAFLHINNTSCLWLLSKDHTENTVPHCTVNRTKQKTLFPCCSHYL